MRLVQLLKKLFSVFTTTTGASLACCSSMLLFNLAVDEALA